MDKKNKLIILGDVSGPMEKPLNEGIDVKIRAGSNTLFEDLEKSIINVKNTYGEIEVASILFGLKNYNYCNFIELIIWTIEKIKKIRNIQNTLKEEKFEQFKNLLKINGAKYIDQYIEENKFISKDECVFLYDCLKSDQESIKQIIEYLPERVKNETIINQSLGYLLDNDYAKKVTNIYDNNLDYETRKAVKFAYSLIFKFSKDFLSYEFNRKIKFYDANYILNLIEEHLYSLF